ncbi:hypothetical protein [Priestia endophytica]|uniref:hypothetical protein n=1 Tax=Priestia endophytica TaxID=135735 RepID=UPI000DCA7DBE|nr:hypothetical protein [Priestia endophytica]RAS80056.1 hypothetical protein A4U60_15375 [Priestia endophytica]
MEEQQNEKMSPKARWIIGGIVTICLAVLIVVAIQLNKKQEPEVATEATQDKKEKTADEQIGSDLEKALSELKKDKSSEEKKTDSKDKTTTTKSSDPFAYLFNPSKSDDPLTFLSIDPTELPDVPEPVVSKTEDVAGVQDDRTPNGPVVTIPTDLNQSPLPAVDDPKLSGDDSSLSGVNEDDNNTLPGGVIIPPTGETGNENNSGTTNPTDSNDDGEHQPDQSGNPDQPSNPNQPDDPDQPSNPNQPGNPNQPDNPVQDGNYDTVSLALNEETYERLKYYAEQKNRENDILYYGNGDPSDTKSVNYMNDALKYYSNQNKKSLTANQLIQSLNTLQMNSTEAKEYNQKLAILQREIRKVTREEYVNVYVMDGGESKNQLYYAGTFADLINGNETTVEKAKKSVMEEADKLAASQQEDNKQQLIEAINRYQLISNYSKEDSEEAEKKRSEAVRALSEATFVEENSDSKDVTEEEISSKEQLEKSLDDFMDNKEYVKVLQQASAYIKEYPELQDKIDKASKKLLNESIEQIKSNDAYRDQVVKDHLAQSYAALVGLSPVPNDVSEKAKDEFYNYRLMMQAEKLIEANPTQAVIFAYEGYKGQETDGAKAILQQANTALSEASVSMEDDKEAERAYEILTVTAKDINADIAQTAADRKTAYGYAAAGEKSYNDNKIEEAIVYGSEANRLYPEKNLGADLVKKAADKLLEDAEKKDKEELLEDYNLIVNIKGLDDNTKDQVKNRKAVMDILERVAALKEDTQDVVTSTQQGLFYLNEAVIAAGKTGWSDEEKAKIQDQYNAYISDMLAQAKIWSTGSDEDKKNAAVYYKVIAEEGDYAGDGIKSDASNALEELGYQ